MIPIRSMYWCDSLCIRSRSDCPVSATSGARSRNASATAVTRLVAPGPERAQAHPGSTGQPAVGVGHVRPALLMADRDEAAPSSPASDSFRSSVSSPGIPKTYCTPSASRHSHEHIRGLASAHDDATLPHRRSRPARQSGRCRPARRHRGVRTGRACIRLAAGRRLRRLRAGERRHGDGDGRRLRAHRFAAGRLGDRQRLDSERHHRHPRRRGRS